MNGFTTGRLLEPKTLSFLDKVYFESRIVFGKQLDTWMGIVRINSTSSSYQGNKWVYASNGGDLEFQNWYWGTPDYHKYQVGEADCALLHSNKWKNHQSWFRTACHLANAVICEFI